MNFCLVYGGPYHARDVAAITIIKLAACVFVAIVITNGLIKMSKPYIHALSSVKKYGGEPEDYMPIHEFMDISKSVIADGRHRALTHNTWFIEVVIPRIFGETFRRASDGKTVSSRDIAEQHVAEDYHGFIPAATDFLLAMEFEEWMNNGRGAPPSWAKVIKARKRMVKID